MTKIKCLHCLKPRWVRTGAAGVQTLCLRCRRGNHAKHVHDAPKRAKKESSKQEPSKKSAKRGGSASQGKKR